MAKKRFDLSLKIELPDQHEATRVSIGPDGQIRVFDKVGQEIVPKYTERQTHYQRSKGPKFQTRSRVVRGYASVDGLDELAKLESFVVVDTNSTEIEGIKVSAAFFIACKVLVEGDNFRVISTDWRGHVYELHDVPGNPEMLAILKIAHDTLNTRNVPENSTIGFITDSEMDAHAAISARQQTIYGTQYLPQGFSLIYASSDTGQELANKLIKFCDKESKKYLARLKAGSFRRSGMYVLKEEPSVRFRYTYYPSLKMFNLERKKK